MRRTIRQSLARLALAAVVVAAATEWGLALLRPEGGPLGVLQIIAPHLAILGLALVPFSLLERRRTALVPAIVLAAVVVLRFGGEWVSLPTAEAAPRDAPRLAIASWNLE